MTCHYPDLDRNHSLRSKRFRLVSRCRRKERPSNRDFRSVLAARKMDRDPRSFNRTSFRAVFDSRSSFFVPKPHGNACYNAGYRNHGSRGFHKKSVNENFDRVKTGPFLFPRFISAGRMEDRRRNSIFSRRKRCRLWYSHGMGPTNG